MNKVWIGILPDFLAPMKMLYTIEVARLPEVGDRMSVWYPEQHGGSIWKLPVVGSVTGVYGYEADGKIIYKVETGMKAIDNTDDKYPDDLRMNGYRGFIGRFIEDMEDGEIDD